MSWDGRAHGDTGWVALPSIVAGTVRYRVLNRVMWLHVEGNLSMATATPYTVVAAGVIPTALRPSGGVHDYADCAGYPGSITVATTGTVAAAHFSGATRATIGAMLTWPLG